MARKPKKTSSANTKSGPQATSAKAAATQVETLKTTSSTIEAGLNEVLAMQARGEINEAFNRCSQLLELDPKHFELMHLSALLAYQNKQVNLALELMEKAQAINANHALSHFNYANMLRSVGRLEKAVDHYQKAIVLNLNHEQVYYKLGNTLQDLGKIPQAIGCYEKAIALKPDFEWAINTRKLLLSRTQKS